MSEDSTTRTRRRYLFSSLTGALSIALVPLVPFLVFDAEQSGRFSIIYTSFIVMWSTMLSLTSDVRLRAEARGDVIDDRDFRGAQTVIAVLGAAIGLVLALVLGEQPVVWLAVVAAVGGSLLRVARRFEAMKHPQTLPRVLASDLLMAVVFLGVVVVVLVQGVRDTALEWVLAGWAVGAVVGLLPFLPMPLGTPAGGWRWVRGNRGEALPLLGDTILLDAGGSLAPLTLLFWLDLGGFGVYRALTSVGTPVQLLLDPIRPKISGLHSRQLLGARVLGAVLAGGAVLAVAAWAVLALIDHFDLFHSVLGDVAEFAVPAAVYVFGNMLAYFCYLVARGQFSPRLLLAGRLTQTTLQFALPIAGVLLGGLALAVDGFAAAIVIAAVVWLALHVVWVRHGGAWRQTGQHRMGSGAGTGETVPAEA